MDERRRGLLAGLLSNILWGVLPIYWHALRPIDSVVIIFYRVLLCAVASWILANRKYTKEELFAPFRDKKLLLKFIVAGILTATPLMLFAECTNKAGLFAAGLVGYVSPSISLVLSIFLFGEPFEFVQFLAFAIIWIGLGFFTYGELKDMKKSDSH